MEYSPMPGLSAIRIQGCEPGCQHEWAIYTQPPRHGDNGIDGSTLGGGKATQAQAQRQPTQGAYCIHCGGWRGALGLEPDINAYIGHLILVLREMWRVLRDDGTIWWNLGDSYAGSGGAHADHHKNKGISQSAERDGAYHHMPRGLQGVKQKDMLMIPARFALAAQADGWYLRSAMPWIKRNGMPESVTDRPAQVIEWVFLLAKNEQYYYDAEAVKQPNVGTDHNRFGNKNAEARLVKKLTGNMAPGTPQETDRVGRNFRSSDLFFKTWQGLLSNDDGDPLAMVVNPRSYTGSHFAVFPMLIPEIAIKAGSSQYGCCPKCGAPWERVVEKERIFGPKDAGTTNKNPHGEHGQSMARNGHSRAGDHESITTGWRPTCSCGRDDVAPCTVLDPFAGSGTTLRVALVLGRKPVGVDISESYLDELVPARTSNVQMQLAL